MGRRIALATGGAGVAVGLSVVLAAVIGNPGVQTDGTVLVVGVVTGGVLGYLGLSDAPGPRLTSTHAGGGA